MFSQYFENLEKSLIKRIKESQKDAPENADQLVGMDSLGVPASMLRDDLMNLVPKNLVVDAARVVDSSGYMPEGVDFVIFREHFRNFATMMNGLIPSEMVYGTMLMCRSINPENIADIIKKIIQIKKIDHFTESEEDRFPIPSFILGFSSSFELAKLKDEIIDYYMTRSIDHAFEFDIIAILNKGIIIKDWSSKRSFRAIETGKETLKWLFILMNEYLDIDKGNGLDLRKYVTHTEKYKEY